MEQFRQSGMSSWSLTWKMKTSSQATSMTSLSLGTFYAIAAYQNNIPMMVAAVPGRLLATFVFHNSGGGWAKVAPFEAIMGLLTAGGLYWDWRLTRSSGIKKD
jgi:hypothetical protein